MAAGGERSVGNLLYSCVIEEIWLVIVLGEFLAKIRGFLALSELEIHHLFLNKAVRGKLETPSNSLSIKKKPISVSVSVNTQMYPSTYSIF